MRQLRQVLLAECHLQANPSPRYVTPLGMRCLHCQDAYLHLSYFGELLGYVGDQGSSYELTLNPITCGDRDGVRLEWTRAPGSSIARYSSSCLPLQRWNLITRSLTYFCISSGWLMDIRLWNSRAPLAWQKLQGQMSRAIFPCYPSTQSTQHPTR